MEDLPIILTILAIFFGIGLLFSPSGRGFLLLLIICGILFCIDSGLVILVIAGVIGFCVLAYSILEKMFK